MQIPPSAVGTEVVALGAALALMAAHRLGRALHGLPRSRLHVFESFAAGTGVAYVVLDLLVELTHAGREHVHAVLALGPEPEESLFAGILLGLTASYVVEALADRRSPRVRHAAHAVWQFVYYALVGGALVLEAKRGLAPLALYAVAMVLHLTVLEHHLQLTHGAESAAPRPWLVALAPLLGAVLWDVLLPEAMLFVALALVAGSTLVQVVHDELPSPRASHVGGFLLGAALYSALCVLRWR